MSATCPCGIHFSVTSFIPVGVSYQFKEPIVIDARYQIGLTRLNKYTADGVKDSKNSVFTLTVGYKFGL
jgi:hypothetical protein